MPMTSHGHQETQKLVLNYVIELHIAMLSALTSRFGDRQHKEQGVAGRKSLGSTALASSVLDEVKNLIFIILTLA